MLAIETYNQTEQASRRFLSNAQVMGFQPVTFFRVGYPTRATAEEEIASYVDLLSLNPLAYVPYDTGKFLRGASLYSSYSPDEADLIGRVCDHVVELTRARFGRPVRPLINPPTQIGVFRAVQAVSALSRQPKLRILEIGPGFGYLGVYLALQGHSYTAFDVTQGLYLWQNRLFASFFGDEFSEGAATVHYSDVPQRRVMHIPWWQFCRLFEGAVPTFDLVIANGVWGEMSRIALLYAIRLCKDMLKPASYPMILSNNFGNPLETTADGVSGELQKCGFVEVLSTKIHGFSPDPERTKPLFAPLEEDLPLFRPSGRPGELAAESFMKARWDEVPDSLAFNSYVTGWTPPMLPPRDR